MTGNPAPLQEDPSRNGHNHVAAWLNLSHELRTPTNAILGHLELLLSGSAEPLSSEMRASLGDIQRAAVTLSTRIGEIIRLAEHIPGPGPNTMTTSPDRLER